MIRNQKIQGTFICGPLFFKWMGIFQSWLDCFQLEYEHLFIIQNIKFFHLQKSGCWCPFVTIFKCTNLQSVSTFFQVHQFTSDIVPIFHNKRCRCSGD